MCVMVSDVPPFVHGPSDAAIVNADPLEDDVNPASLICSRVVDPTDTEVVPLTPGSPVCSSIQVVFAVLVVTAAPFNQFSQMVATFAGEIPTAITAPCSGLAPRECPGPAPR